MGKEMLKAAEKKPYVQAQVHRGDGSKAKICLGSGNSKQQDRPIS